jgi:hypothetical protein
VVDNYLAADSSLPVPSAAVGPHVNYTAVLTGLDLDATYFYRVSGPGMPSDGFTASFLTRTRSHHFSLLVQGDEGFFPVVPTVAPNPPRIADYEARIVHLMYNAHKIALPEQTEARPEANLALNTGDNVYTFGAEGSYRDFWFPVWNSNVDSNETGAPFIRRYPFTLWSETTTSAAVAIASTFWAAILLFQHFRATLVEGTFFSTTTITTFR